jgi:hypothetical protein
VAKRGMNRRAVAKRLIKRRAVAKRGIKRRAVAKRGMKRRSMARRGWKRRARKRRTVARRARKAVHSSLWSPFMWESGFLLFSLLKMVLFVINDHYFPRFLSPNSLGPFVFF